MESMTICIVAVISFRFNLAIVDLVLTYYLNRMFRLLPRIVYLVCHSRLHFNYNYCLDGSAKHLKHSVYLMFANIYPFLLIIYCMQGKKVTLLNHF